MKTRSKIYLDKKKRTEALCDREDYFKKYGEYDKQGYFKKMQKGAPLVINIDGYYYYFDKLVPLFGCDTIEEYRNELKSPINDSYPLIFIWR